MVEMDVQRTEVVAKKSYGLKTILLGCVLAVTAVVFYINTSATPSTAGKGRSSDTTTTSCPDYGTCSLSDFTDNSIDNAFSKDTCAKASKANKIDFSGALSSVPQFLQSASALSYKLGCLSLEYLAAADSTVGNSCTGQYCAGCGDGNTCDATGYGSEKFDFTSYDSYNSQLGGTDADGNGVPDGIDACYGPCEYNFALYSDYLSGSTCQALEGLLSGCDCSGSLSCEECREGSNGGYGKYLGSGQCDFSDLYGNDASGSSCADCNDLVTCAGAGTVQANQCGEYSAADTFYATYQSVNTCAGCANCCHEYADNGVIASANKFCPSFGDSVTEVACSTE